MRHGFAPGSFARQAEVTFGAGANETPLQQETEAGFADLMQRLFESRYPEGSARNPLFRMQPEAWLQSTLAGDLSQIDDSLGGQMIYQQVPAFAAADRAMLDLLTVTRGGRLAILELKADEDLHFPLQALDYWIRVHWLQQQRNASGEGDSGAERILPWNSAVAPCAALVLHSPCIACASIDGYRAAALIPGDPLDARSRSTKAGAPKEKSSSASTAGFPLNAPPCAALSLQMNCHPDRSDA